MKHLDVIAAILTVGFYSSRGAAMGLPQIIATYNEVRDLLAAELAAKKRKKK